MRIFLRLENLEVGLEFFGLRKKVFNFIEVKYMVFGVYCCILKFGFVKIVLVDWVNVLVVFWFFY